MFKLIQFAAVSMTAVGAHAAQFDPPDLGLEMQLHHRYMGIQAPRAAGNDGRSEVYRLQSGETLWTLSEMLYGDGNYWPRVWAQNPGVSDPHLVRPGHQLQFLLGSEDQTPAFRFSEEDEGVELAAAPGQNPIVEIPPPEVPPKPVAKIPRSFPNWSSIFKRPPEKILIDRQLGRVRGPLGDKLYLSAYVQEQPLESLGEFLEIDSEAGLPVANQYVYVKIRKGMGSVGQKLLVAKDMGQIRKIGDHWKEKQKANLIQLYAELELTEPVTSSFKKSRDRIGFDTYRALIIRTTGLSTKDTVLIPGTLNYVDLRMKGSSGTGSGLIIGSSKHVASAMYGQGDFIFLNRGSAQGLEEGQLFDVFSNRTIRRPDTPVTQSPAPAGTVKIVKVTENLATAIVLKATESIQQGDMFGRVTSHAEMTEKRNYSDGGQSIGDEQLPLTDEEDVEEDLGDEDLM